MRQREVEVSGVPEALALFRARPGYRTAKAVELSAHRRVLLAEKSFENTQTWQKSHLRQ
jgi:hypothetical protein